MFFLKRVALTFSYSVYSLIESGVPLGSLLDPLLFLVYINDLETNIKSNFKFFADDIMLYSIFILKNTPQITPQLFFNRTEVTKVNQQKQLGIILENDLSFEKHLGKKKLGKQKRILAY